MDELTEAVKRLIRAHNDLCHAADWKEFMVDEAMLPERKECEQPKKMEKGTFDRISDELKMEYPNGFFLVAFRKGIFRKEVHFNPLIFAMDYPNYADIKELFERLIECVDDASGKPTPKPPCQQHEWIGGGAGYSPICKHCGIKAYGFNNPKAFLNITDSPPKPDYERMWKELRKYFSDYINPVFISKMDDIERKGR